FAATLFASVAAVGQGQFVFNNRVPPAINARFILNITDPSDGSRSSIGTDYMIELFFREPVTQALLPLDPPSTAFRGPAGSSEAGYVVPTTETVPGVPPGAIASITIRLLGPSPFDCQQDYGPWTVTLGGGTITPPNLPLGTTPLVSYLCPEPSLAVLALIGFC